jgi:O-antigen ligase
VLGVYAPRPAAPFAFTNAWGCTLALLLIWLIVYGWSAGTRVRLAVAVVVALSVVPIVYSLDRGVWIGLGLAVVYIAARLALRGRLLAIGALALVLGLGTITFLASPLQTLVSERLSHGHSNEIRSSLATAALDTAKESPLLGFGSTRAVRGSTASIAVGQTASCPKCGNAEIGSTGQYFLLLVAQGFLGTGVYVAYFLRTLWAYRRDASPIGLGSTLAILLSLFFGIAYSALIMPLAVVFLSIGLLWRNAAVRAGAGGPVAVLR